MELLHLRKAEFEKKTESIKQHLLKFDNFVKENDRKRRRAVMKAHREQVTKRQKEADLQQLQREIAALRLRRDHLTTKHQAFAIFLIFTERVVQASDAVSPSPSPSPSPSLSPSSSSPPRGWSRPPSP
eukprot:gi/632991225/ref/XP_007884531.1/ PREDICTED: coiled-coil domain-containing protein 42A-like [Callorhinchus milii]